MTYLPNFLDGSDRLVAFDAETTGKRTPDAEFIRKQPFAWKAPGIIIEVGFVEMLREGEGWRKGEMWSSRVNPDGPIDPEAIKIHRIRPGDLKNAPRFSTILPKVKDFVGDSPIVAHANKNEQVSSTMSSPEAR
jgi:DNA polymerase III subunit epsilon